jgi:hypothetical protein
MTDRINWQHEDDGTTTGHTGTNTADLFQIWPPEDDETDHMLVHSLPGSPHGPACDSDPDKLKGTAEEWLKEFITSLGAVFPDEREKAAKAARTATAND